jgi:hypothetical protein
MNDAYAPTDKQIAYVRGIQRKLSLPNRMLDGHCEQKWGCPFDELDRGLVSRLIDEMLGWHAIPAQLQREMGQLDLMEVEA